MADVVLIYPFFQPYKDKSMFRFPPLGIGYIASYLSQNGIDVKIIDGTFQNESSVVDQVVKFNPKIIGMQCILGTEKNAIRLARILRKDNNILIVGGHYPSIDPSLFLNDFDVAVIGEGEYTALEIVQNPINYHDVSGIAYKDGKNIVYTKPRKIIEDLDSLPFPARNLFPNQLYQSRWRNRFGYAMTSIITTRGCPFNCDYCSRAVSGNKYRQRSRANVVDEIEQILSYGYDRIWIADDVFTLNKDRVTGICDEIIARGLKFQWECLTRADTFDLELARKMKASGCVRVFFGIESGSNNILQKMKKHLTIEQADFAVKVAVQTGLKTGAFFILGYPGEDDNTILETINFSNSLPLDYLSFSFPYPFPGTGLYEKVKDRLLPEYWNFSDRSIMKHRLVFKSDFSEAKLKFALFKGNTQFWLRKHCKRYGSVPYNMFDKITKFIFKSIN